MPAAPFESAGRWDAPLRKLRIVLFLALVAYMSFGPIYRQVLGERHPLFRPWTMFSRIGLGLADVRFSQRLADGTLVALDHYRVLGYADWREAPLGLRKIRGLAGVQSVATQLCTRMGEGTDLRARVRLARREGWRTEIMEADGNLCAVRAKAGDGEGADAVGD